MDRIAAVVLLAGAIGLSVDAVNFHQHPPSPYLGNPVQWSPESYISSYFAIYAVVALALSVAVYPFRSGSIFRARVLPWASSLKDSALRGGRLKKERSLLVGITALTLAFLILRLAFLSIFEGPDEGLYRAAALDFLDGRCGSPPIHGEGACNLQHPPLAKVLMLVSMQLAGPTMTAARYPSVLLGTLTIPLVAYIMWVLTKNRTATILTAFLLFLDPLFFAWTALANLDTVEIFFTAAGFALYVSPWKKEQNNAVKNIVVGVLMGLSLLSKAVAILALAGIVTFHLVTSKEVKLKGAILILGSASATFALGLQVFDSLFTPFPNLLYHVWFMLDYASHEIESFSNPIYWLVSVTSEQWGNYSFILNVFVSTLALVWLPVGIWKIRRDEEQARALILASLWLLWTYLPYEVIYLAGRVEYYYYTVQLVPALALGGAYLISSSRFARSLTIFIIGGAVVWFALFFPLSQPFLPGAFLPP